MQIAGWKAAVATGMVCFGAVGCGSSNPAVNTVQPTPPAVNLKGNWLLTGALPTSSELQPAAGFTATFDVNGTAVTATMEVRSVCGAIGTGEIFGLGGSFLTGTVAEDGSFTVKTTTQGALPQSAVTITGAIPKAPGATWVGNYTISGGTGTCAPNGSGSFAAESIGPVTGTYTGTGNLELASTSGLGSVPTLTTVPSTVTLTLQQDGPLYGLPPATVDSEIAVDGSVQVSGVPCFSKGTVSTVQTGIISGAIAQPTFLMDDGSKMIVVAEVLDDGAKKLWVHDLNVIGGKCAGVYLFGSAPLIVQAE